MSSQEICFMTAVEMVNCLRFGDLSARQIMVAHLDQIKRINPKVNAIVTLCAEEAMKQAAVADEALVHNRKEVGPLHGLPIAHKDLTLTKGIQTTFGSPVFQDFIPDQDGLIIERLKQAGAITVGKTNTPEFGAGSQTYNEVFGETLNPYDISKTCGGSSGGAAVALACGMQPIADGSDMGGSLRNPASFCNVVGFRPSPGRVPVWPSLTGWFPISVQGPMARTVADVSLVLSAIAGPDPRSPISISESGDVFKQSLDRDFSGVHIAWSQDLGEFPVDKRITKAIEGQKSVFESIGCVIIDDQPDFTDADEIFKIWRAWHFELAYAELLETHRDQLKDTVIWNIEEGQKLSGVEIGRAEIKLTQLYQRIREFMEKSEFLVLPVSQVPPFDIRQRYVTEINGVDMETYIDWMKSCYYISITGLPSISVPCGFTSEGLPVGIQIVGRHQDDFGVLQLAYAFEQSTGFWKQKPTIVA